MFPNDPISFIFYRESHHWKVIISSLSGWWLLWRYFKDINMSSFSDPPASVIEFHLSNLKIQRAALSSVTFGFCLCWSLSNSSNVLQNVSKGTIKHIQLSQNISLSVVCKIKPFILCKGKQWLAFTAIINYFALMPDTCRTEWVFQKVRKMKGFPQGHACHTSVFQKQTGRDCRGTSWLWGVFWWGEEGWVQRFHYMTVIISVAQSRD